jgi:hypothetical protein
MDLWTSEQEISVLLKKGQISSVSSNTFSNNTILPPSPAHQITEGIRKKKTYKADCQHTLITTCSHLQFVPDISPPLPHPALLDRRFLRPPSPQPQLRRSILSYGRATLTSPPSSTAPACTSRKIHCRWANRHRGVHGSGYVRHLLHCLPRPQFRLTAPFLGSLHHRVLVSGGCSHADGTV